MFVKVTWLDDDGVKKPVVINTQNVSVIMKNVENDEQTCYLHFLAGGVTMMRIVGTMEETWELFG